MRRPRTSRNSICSIGAATRSTASSAPTLARIRVPFGQRLSPWPTWRSRRKPAFSKIAVSMFARRSASPAVMPPIPAPTMRTLVIAHTLRGFGGGSEHGLRRADGFCFFAREAARDDLRDAVAAHRDAVQDVGGFHRSLLVRDHDELSSVRVPAQQRDEAADVRVVERGLDLVEQIERTGPSEEQREEERDGSECLLAARQERQALHLLAGRPQLDLDAGLALLVLGVGQAQA